MRYYTSFIIFILTFCCLHLGIQGFSQEKIKLIVIDPGHGGIDSGCSYGHKHEKIITLQLAKEIGSRIHAEFPEIEVRYTRTDDRFIALHERIGIANELGADLFISVHINSFSSDQVRGAESYVLGIDEQNEFADIVSRENASIAYETNSGDVYSKFDLYSPASRIIISTYQQNFLDNSIRFADALQQSISRNTKLPDRGVRQAPFVVLRMATMPAVLFEAGFITEEQDRAYLADSAGKSAIAESFVQAVRHYILRFEQANLKEPNIFVASNTLPVDHTEGKTDQMWLENGRYRLKIQVMTSLNKCIEKEDRIWSDFPDLDVRQEKEVFNYLTGEYTSIHEARNALKSIRNTGYPGAYIVVLNGDERISIK